VLLRYAVAACGGIDGLAVTHLDHARAGLSAALAHRVGSDVITELPPGDDLTTLSHRCVPTLTRLPDEPAAVVDWFERLLDVPVRVTGAGADRSAYRVRVPLPLHR
jgi:adenylosuccinate synthase